MISSLLVLARHCADVASNGNELVFEAVAGESLELD